MVFILLNPMIFLTFTTRSPEERQLNHTAFFHPLPSSKEALCSVFLRHQQCMNEKQRGFYRSSKEYIIIFYSNSGK